MAKVQIILPEWLADRYAAQIRDTGGDRIELLPVDENDPTKIDISQAQVALHGFWYGSTRFSSLRPGMPKLQWIHVTGAGIDDLASPEWQNSGVWLTNVSGGYASAIAEYALAAIDNDEPRFSRLVCGGPPAAMARSRGYVGARTPWKADWDHWIWRYRASLGGHMPSLGHAGLGDAPHTNVCDRGAGRPVTWCARASKPIDGE